MELLVCEDILYKSFNLRRISLSHRLDTGGKTSNSIKVIENTKDYLGSYLGRQLFEIPCAYIQRKCSFIYLKIVSKFHFRLDFY